MSSDDDLEYQIFDCMTFSEIYNEALEMIRLEGHKELNDNSQESFDDHFNYIFCESYDINPNVKERAFINYITLKEKMFLAQKFCERKGLEIGSNSYRIAFLQCMDKHIREAYEESMTPSNQIGGKNKESMITLNPIKSKALIPDEVWSLFGIECDSKKKSKDFKSGILGLTKFMGSSVLGMKEISMPVKATSAKLVEIEKYQYSQLVVFVMVMTHVGSVLNCSLSDIDKLVERFLPVDEDAKYNYKMLGKTGSKVNFVKNIIKVMQK